jgi:CubicO group peptidase (beta-lactamase class C family)
MRILCGTMKHGRRGLGIAAGLFTVVVAAAPTGAAGLPDDLAEQVRSYVTSELAALGAPGAAVAIVHDDEVVFAEGFGDAGGAPLTAETPFDLASVSKSLTAIAIFQLAEAGSLSLDDRVGDHVAWIGDTYPTLGEVTVRELLAHSSGWTIGDGQANLANTYDAPDAIERNVRRLASISPTNPRGTFEYSNAN